MQRKAVSIFLLGLLLNLPALSEPAMMATETPESTSSFELPIIALPVRFTMGPNEIAIAQQQGGYYRPVPEQQPYQRACGTVATDICPMTVQLPAGATGAQVYDMGKSAEASHRKGEALWLLQKSGELGYAPAQGAIGMDYLRGIGLPNDQAKGIYWLTQAAKQGSAKAEMMLGACYEEGSNGLDADEPRAIAFFKAAAAQHESLGEFRLGLDYEIGRGVVHDRATAIEYLHRAATDGQSMAGKTAAFLGRSREQQFHSIVELDAAMSPAPAPRAAGAPVPARCPAENSFTGYGVRLETAVRTFCYQNPECPVHVEEGNLTYDYNCEASRYSWN